MGKRGNKVRQRAKKHATMDEAIQNVLAEDEHLKAQTDAAALRAAEERVYGKPGPPSDNVVWLGMPTPQKRKIVDCLGRVIEIKDNIPDLLKASPMAKKTENPAPASVSNEAEPTRRITIMRDHELEYPELYMEIFVSPDPQVRDDEARFAQMFARSRCSRAKSVLESDLVVFAGGADVDPALYGEARHMTTFPNTARDDRDIALYKLCVEEGIPMLGVCRGAQFLHVMNGGKLYQNVDEHYGDHKMWDVGRKFFVERVSSVHHQMVIHDKRLGMEILGTNGDARVRARNANPKDNVIGAKADVEAFWYRDTCCFGVQGHPEYANYNFFTKWVLDYINELILCSPDIEWRGGNRRVRQDLLVERKHRAPSVIMPVASGKKEKN